MVAAGRRRKPRPLPQASDGAPDSLFPLDLSESGLKNPARLEPRIAEEEGEMLEEPEKAHCLQEQRLAAAWEEGDDREAVVDKADFQPARLTGRLWRAHSAGLLPHNEGRW